MAKLTTPALAVNRSHRLSAGGAFTAEKNHVYEEGLGTYRKDLYTGTRKRLFDYFGIGTFFGGNFPLNGSKIRWIRKSLSDFITENCSDLQKLFGFDNVMQSLKTPPNIGISILVIGRLI
ncbi:MAG: hypothetical protein ACTFAK_12245 [Candidatus Electronema sp. VV]